MQSARPTNPIWPQRHREYAIAAEACARGVRDGAKFVDAGYEGPYEAEINEGNEDGGVTGGFAAEEGHDGPDGAKDRHDEEC